jgi:hypothetical protein
MGANAMNDLYEQGIDLIATALAIKALRGVGGIGATVEGELHEEYGSIQHDIRAAAWKKWREWGERINKVPDAEAEKRELDAMFKRIGLVA